LITVPRTSMPTTMAAPAPRERAESRSRVSAAVRLVVSQVLVPPILLVSSNIPSPESFQGRYFR
jgi:hypothetical protein